MKKMKRMLCVVAVIALLLTMTTAVSAATRSSATVTVTKLPNNYSEQTPIVGTMCNHVKGTPNTISYNLEEDQATRYLDTSSITTAYLETVLMLCEREGFKRSVSVPCSGTVTIPAVAANGVYVVVKNYSFGTAAWEASIDSVHDAGGYISEAPISMSLAAIIPQS